MALSRELQSSLILACFYFIRVKTQPCMRPNRIYCEEGANVITFIVHKNDKIHDNMMYNTFLVQVTYILYTYRILCLVLAAASTLIEVANLGYA